MLEQLKAEVCKGNLDLVTEGLVIQTWGNASAVSSSSSRAVGRTNFEPMNRRRKHRNVNRTLPAGGVMAADAGQWHHWLSLSPSERLEAANRLWLQIHEFNKQTRRSLKPALRARPARF